MSILTWVYTQGKPGPIVNFHPSGWGVHVWMVSRTAVFVRFTRRRGRVLTKPLISKRMQPNKWKFIAATYNRHTQIAEVYIDGRRMARRRIGRIRLATNYPIRVGARKGDARRLKGRIACLQIYNKALNARQIRARMNMCFGPGKLYCSSLSSVFRTVSLILYYPYGYIFILFNFRTSTTTSFSKSSWKRYVVYL